MAERTVVGLVRRLQAGVLISVLLLLAILVAGSLVSWRATQHLADEVFPAVVAHEAVLQDMTDAETGVRAYSLTGEPETLAPYRDGLASLPGHLAVVDEYAADDPVLTELADAQQRAARAWLDAYASVKVAGPGGVAAFDPQLFVRGESRFDALRAAHARLGAALERDVAAAEAEARERLVGRSVVAGTAMVLLLVGGVVASRRVRREVVEPLRDMETTVRRLTAGATDARAREDGRREVHSVAVALNALAEEQARARAVEEHIREELRRFDTAKSDFVSNVSHELRTPLTTIAGYAEMVAEEFEGRMSPHHERMLDAATRNVERLRVLIDDILTLSRAEGSSTSLERVALRDVVADCVADLRMAAARRQIDLELAGEDDDALLVLADRGQVSRALLNVVGNAVKFSPDGARVLVATRREHDEVVVEVVDRGIGIPADELALLGTRFFRASNAVDGSVPGTGLGLRIVQTIVANHGGRLQLESVEGEGTTVTVRLPAQATR